MLNFNQVIPNYLLMKKIVLLIVGLSGYAFLTNAQEMSLQTHTPVQKQISSRAYKIEKESYFGDAVVENNVAMANDLRVKMMVDDLGQGNIIDPQIRRAQDASEVTNVSYSRPLTNLFFGISDTDEFLPTTIMAGPVFSPVTFTGKSTNKEVEYTWTYTDGHGEEKTSTGKNLTITYITNHSTETTSCNNLYEFPVLTASSATTAPADFTYDGYYQAGGDGSYKINDEGELVNFGLTIADPNTEGRTTYEDETVPYFGYNQESDNYWGSISLGEDFGGSNWAKMETIGDFFYTPDSPIVINGVRLNAYGKVSQDAKFTAEIYQLTPAFEIPNTPDYSAECTGADIKMVGVSPNRDFLSLNFKFDKPVVLSKSVAPYFIVTISGFHDAENVEYFSPEMTAYSNPNNLGLGWVGMQVSYNGVTNPKSWSPVANYTDDERVAFYIMLDAAFPWLESELDEVTVGVSPSDPCYLVMDSYYDGSELSVEGLPSWLKAEVFGRYDKSRVKFTSIGTGTEPAEVTIAGPGVNKKIKVTQGERSSIISIENNCFTGEEQVFTLTGQSVVGEPTPGLYIVLRSDGSATKTYIR